MDELRATARATGLWYLALAITGLLGFLIVRPMIYVPGDPALTAQNLIERAALARVGVALELGIVASQALVAVWFYKLFRSFNSVAAGTLAAFGLVNAVALLASAAAMAAAVQVSGDAGLAPRGDVAATVQLLYAVSSKLWSVAAVFFGLWLIPMGYVTVSSRRMPKALGWVLMVGGGGYVLSALLAEGLAGAPTWLVEGLTIPASIGEFWMIGYLLAVGIRPSAGTPA